MDTDQILTAVSNYGFPIVISWYLLVRMESKLDSLAKHIDTLSNAIDSLLR